MRRNFKIIAKRAGEFTVMGRQISVKKGEIVSVNYEEGLYLVNSTDAFEPDNATKNNTVKCVVDGKEQTIRKSLYRSYLNQGLIEKMPVDKANKKIEKTINNNVEANRD